MKSASRLSALEAAYVSGFRQAMTECKADLRRLAARYDEQLIALESEYRVLRAESERYRQIEAALNVTVDDQLWLH
jgi:hypothetical protein